MKKAPSILPKCELMPLPDYIPDRRYFTYDLNNDGIPEWFIENYAGANTMSFALIDSSGNLLIRDCDIDCFGEHRIIILNYQHGGYRDILTSYFSPNEIYSTHWKYNGTHYVRGKAKRIAFEDWQDESKVSGMSVAVWNSFGEIPHKQSSNQQVDPIVTTPVDKVEPQSTQGHP